MSNPNAYSDQPRYSRDVCGLMRRINALEAAVTSNDLAVKFLSVGATVGAGDYGLYKYSTDWDGALVQANEDRVARYDADVSEGEASLGWQDERTDPYNMLNPYLQNRACTLAEDDRYLLMLYPAEPAPGEDWTVGGAYWRLYKRDEYGVYQVLAQHYCPQSVCHNAGWDQSYWYATCRYCHLSGSTAAVSGWPYGRIMVFVGSEEYPSSGSPWSTWGVYSVGTDGSVTVEYDTWTRDTADWQIDLPEMFSTPDDKGALNNWGAIVEISGSNLWHAENRNSGGDDWQRIYRVDYTTSPIGVWQLAYTPTTPIRISGMIYAGYNQATGQDRLIFGINDSFGETLRLLEIVWNRGTTTYTATEEEISGYSLGDRQLYTGRLEMCMAGVYFWIPAVRLSDGASGVLQLLSGDYSVVQFWTYGHQYDQTEWRQYIAFDNTPSLGTPDAGVSVPDLEALTDGAIVEPLHLIDMRNALYGLAPYYINATTGDPWDWGDPAGGNNLLYESMGDRTKYGATGGARNYAFGWTNGMGNVGDLGVPTKASQRESMLGLPTYDIDIGEIEECVTTLEASELAQ